jgi:hypothetical protein
VRVTRAGGGWYSPEKEYAATRGIMTEMGIAK